MGLPVDRRVIGQRREGRPASAGRGRRSAALMTDEVSIWIVVLSYNGLQDTRKCLTSVARAIRPGVTALLVDNGSSDDTAEIVSREYAWCRVLRIEENRGPAAGNNAGLRAALAADCDWILLLNNDTVVDPALID